MADGYYYAEFGKCDGSDQIDCEIDLNDEQEKAYMKAWMYRRSYDEFPELDDALYAARKEIEEMEIDNFLDMDDEYVQECLGKYPMDEDELISLIQDRDEHALEFFGLMDMSDEEIEEWLEDGIDDIPDVCDFDPDFEPESPFDGGWDLTVCFSGEPEDAGEMGPIEAKWNLKRLIEAANGDWSELKEFVSECEDNFDWDACEDLDEFPVDYGVEEEPELADIGDEDDELSELANKILKLLGFPEINWEEDADGGNV